MNHRQIAVSRCLDAAQALRDGIAALPADLKREAVMRLDSTVLDGKVLLANLWFREYQLEREERRAQAG